MPKIRTPKAMQDRIMAAIVDRLDTDKFEVVIDRQYANTGTIRAVPEGHFTSRYSLSYSFNDGNCSFKHTKADVTGLRGHPASTRGFYINYDKGEKEFTDQLERIIQFLEGEDQ